MTMYIGIDNGLGGGIAVIDGRQNIVAILPMPVIKGKKTEYDINGLKILFRTFRLENNIHCVLEKSHVRPVSGKRACFMTGYGYGVMQAMLEAFDISYEIVDPKVWQKDLFKGINTGDTKKDSIMFCKRKFPNIKLNATERSKKDHDGMADALCMAIYCYKTNGGK